MNKPTAAPDGTPERRDNGRQKGKKPVVAQLDSHIGKELRSLYASILEEPIPDRFLTLIQSFEVGDDNETTAKKP